MRILVVTTSYPQCPGDPAGHFIAAACEALAQRGHTLTVLAPHAPGLALAEDARGVVVRRFRYGLVESCECVAYGDGIPDNLRRSWRARLAVPSFLCSMRSAILREAPQADVIHAHWAICGMLARAAAQRHRIPLVVSLRGTDTAKTTGPMGWIARRACSAANRIVAVSSTVADTASALGALPAHVRVIPNGIALDAYENLPPASAAREALGLPQDGVLFLAVGRLVPVKDLPLLLQAFSRLRAAHPDARLALVGDGPERSSLEAQAKQLGIAEAVCFAGAVPHDAVPSWMAAADALVLSSKREGRPNVVLEAMAAGLPVVSTRAGGVVDLVDDGNTGFLVPVEDEEGLVHAMQTVHADAALRLSMGQAARDKMSQTDVSWAAHARSLDALYAELVEK